MILVGFKQGMTYVVDLETERTIKKIALKTPQGIDLGFTYNILKAGNSMPISPQKKREVRQP